ARGTRHLRVPAVRADGPPRHPRAAAQLRLPGERRPPADGRRRRRRDALPPDARGADTAAAESQVTSRRRGRARRLAHAGPSLVRRHHRAGDGNALDGIRAERRALSDLREIADRILDTSALTVHQLKDRLVELYVAPKARPGLATSLVSFGFKHGVPFDADLVFDVRFLPNPHFVEALRPLDGRHERVRAFVLDHPLSKEMIRRLEDFLKFVLPCYEREGKA